MQGEELDTFLGPPFGVSVVCGAVSGSGLLDEPDVDVGGVMISTDRSVLVRAALFAAVAVHGAAITVDDVAYKVRTLHRQGDGAFARITLEAQ